MTIQIGFEDAVRSMAELRAKDAAEQRVVFEILRASIRKMLQNPYIFEWTLQGFGMLRCYIPGPVYDKQFRLNVWDHKLATPSVSTVHDHPWHFKSWIINGNFTNVRFVEDHFPGVPFEYRVIKTGIDGTPQDDTRLRMNLRMLEPEHYSTGDVYEQKAEEIHNSIPARGTVTLNARIRIGDGEHARVFWPADTDWVDAKPRPAARREIGAACALAQESWG